MRLAKLNQAGDHIVIVAVFIALFGIAGTFFLLRNNAAPSYVMLHLGDNSGPCLEASGSGVSSNVLIEGCNSGNKNQQWTLASGTGGFVLKTAAGYCADDWDGHVQPTNGYTPLRMNTCYNNKNQSWNWTGSGAYRLTNVTSGSCINSTGASTAADTVQIVYTCNSQSNETWFKTSVGTTTTTTGSDSSVGQQFANRAAQFKGLAYNNSGGGLIHTSGYSSYIKSCEHGGVSGGTPVISASVDSTCTTDCSGFVSTVVDDVLHTNYSWIVNGSGVMTGGSWHAISLSQVKPGDIVTIPDHVEFVVSGTGSNITTIGEHNSSSKVGDVNWGTYWDAAYRWE